MPEKFDNTTPLPKEAAIPDSAGQLKLLQENNRLLHELQHSFAVLKRVQTISLIIKIVFIVLPIIGALIFLPRIIQEYTQLFMGNVDTSKVILDTIQQQK